MDLGQRRGLIAGAAAAGVALIVLLVAVVSPGHRSSAAAHPPGNATQQALTSTTADLAPVPGGTGTTVKPQPVGGPTTVPPPTTTTVAPPPTVGPEGAFLTPLNFTDVRIADPLNCSAVSDGPNWSTRCGVAHSSGGDLMWVIESAPAPQGTAWHVYALRHLQGYHWLVTVAVADNTGQRQWIAVRAAAVDVTGDGNQDLVYGFHYAEPAASLVLDVVSGAGRVDLHRWIVEGAVQLSAGQLQIWGAGPGGVGYGHEVLRYLSGAWRIVSSTPAPPVIPPSSV